MSEIREAVYNPDKAMAVNLSLSVSYTHTHTHTHTHIHPHTVSLSFFQRLERDGLVMKITRPDKEEIIFYNDQSLQLPVAEEFKGLWHRVSVDGLTETDIDRHLELVGVGAMQGQGRKRQAPTATQKAKKKSRFTKVLNTHLDSSLLKDYSEKTS